MQDFATQYSISQLLYFADSFADYLHTDPVKYKKQDLADFQTFDFVENKYSFGDIKKKLKGFEQNNTQDGIKIVVADLFVPIERNGYLDCLQNKYKFENQAMCMVPKLMDICKNDASIVLEDGFQIGFWDVSEFVAINNFTSFEQTFTGRIISSLEIENNFMEQEISGAYLIKHYNILSKIMGIGSKIYSWQKLFELKDNLAHFLLQRSASLTATWIYGIWIYAQSPLKIDIYGELICNKNYQKLIYNQLQDFGIAREIELIKV